MVCRTERIKDEMWGKGVSLRLSEETTILPPRNDV